MLLSDKIVNFGNRLMLRNRQLKDKEEKFATNNKRSIDR
jgi:hypothetical protein